jgi:hypothetical protein
MVATIKTGAEVFQNLSSAPGATPRHHWADWAEILLFAAPYGELTLSEFAERIERRRDFFPAELEDAADSAAAPEDEPLGELFEEPREDRDGAWEAMFRDATVKRAREAFELMLARSRAYGDDYPFAVDSTSSLMELKGPLTSRHKAYLFFLACSSLKYLRAPLSDKLPALFEVVAGAALEAVHRGAYEVKLFGKNAYQPTDFSGHISKKIEKLASWLQEVPIPQKARFNKFDHGDGGLDIVARLKIGDDIDGSAVIFGQCACTPSWIVKQHSSSGHVWAGRMSFTAPPLNSAFIPHDFRSAERGWYAPQDIHATVLFDRFRLLKVLPVQYIDDFVLHEEIVALIAAVAEEAGSL